MITLPKPNENSEAYDSEFARPSRVEDGGAYSDGDGDDPAWVPGKPVKHRVRHKYSTRVDGNRGRRRNRVSIRSPELQKTVLPGAIELATPLITGKMRDPLERPSVQRLSFRTPGSRNSFPGVNQEKKPRRTHRASFPAYQGSWKEVVDMSGDTEFINIAHLLDRVFLKFLNNTRPNIPPWQPTRGVRSLLSMAVRRLPEFIEDEQQIQDETEGDDDVNMCDAYFYELENLYAPNGNGWQPLREAVRAQGIYMVSEMLQRQWVTKLAACRLMQECMNHQEFDAFELLSSKYLSTMDSYDYPTAFDSPKSSTHCDDPISILGSYYLRVSTRRSFIFNEMAKLLLRGVVPPEWMVTKVWKKCVDGAITSFSTGDENSTAAKCLIEAVVLAAGNVYPATDTAAEDRKRLSSSRPLHLRATRASAANAPGSSKDQLPCPIPIQDALSNLTLSLIAALCGIHIARTHNSAAEEQVIGMKMKESVKSLAFTVQREIEIRPPPQDADILMFQFLRRGYVLLGQCLLLCGDAASEDIRLPDSVSCENSEAFFTLLSSRPEVVKELATLVRQVFRCYEHVHKSHQTRTSPEIRYRVSRLVRLSGDGGLSILLGKVAAETAMDLAETTVDPDDHVWAVEIQEKVVSFQQEQAIRHGTGQGRMSNNSGLYRWEESIDEWVAATPMWKVKAVEVATKKLGAVRRPPSTIANSESSDSPTLSSSKSSSSMTSPASSVSMKRGRSDSVSRSSKRRNLTPVAMYSDEESMSADDAESSTSDETCELTSATPSASMHTRRGALRELTQTSSIPRRMARRGMDPGSAANFEVVITNKRDLEPNGSPEQSRETSPDQTTHSATSPLPTRTRRTLPGKPIPSIAPRAPRARSVIPCSQDDESEDEINCL